jgi:toxin ParE1/3/4
MRIVWSPSAIAQLAEIRAYIEQDKPEAAREVARRIIAAADRLSANPRLGRPGRHPRTRELIIPGTPYLLPYRIQGQQIKILAVFHAARLWPEKE